MFSDFDASQWKLLLEEECTRDGSGRVHEEVKGTLSVHNSSLKFQSSNILFVLLYPSITVVNKLQGSEMLPREVQL